MIFSAQTLGDSSPRHKRWLSGALAFVLTVAATALMMLCPCDIVGIHRHYAISLVALAAVFAIAAACVLYRRMSRDSGITAFLRAVIALAMVAVSVFVELFVAMEIVAWMARRK